MMLKIERTMVLPKSCRSSCNRVATRQLVSKKKSRRVPSKEGGDWNAKHQQKQHVRVTFFMTAEILAGMFHSNDRHMKIRASSREDRSRNTKIYQHKIPLAM